ncbi:molybdenum cofactor guanylyltransferase MobA [Halomonas sp. V046]|uniref:molybdenum cofactor guanylyltransferase MobA n=1 Tax=Halomonas sp. V046 TaxID=3459611 RepID=UPI004043C45B
MSRLAAREVTGVVLAGGQGRRMGGVDKGLVPFAGRPLVAHAAACLRPHVGELVINANRHRDAYAEHADRVITDVEDGFQGPLMGIYSGLRAARTPWVVFIPCDSPALPGDLVVRLVAGLAERGEGTDILVAHDGERLHPVVALMRRSLADDLHQALLAGERKIDRWYARHAWAPHDLSDCAAAFANLNTEEERVRLEAQLSEARP